MPHVHKITPFLGFEDQAEEAAQFYSGIFKTRRDCMRRVGDCIRP